MNIMSPSLITPPLESGEVGWGKICARFDCPKILPTLSSLRSISLPKFRERESQLLVMQTDPPCKYPQLYGTQY